MDTQYDKYRPVLQLSEIDGNAFFIIGTCVRLMKRCGAFTQDEINEFKLKATSGDYDHLLQTVMDYFDCS